MHHRPAAQVPPAINPQAAQRPARAAVQRPAPAAVQRVLATVAARRAAPPRTRLTWRTTKRRTTKPQLAAITLTRVLRKALATRAPLEKALVQNPSPGGHIQPANRMAHIIRGRSLDTAVAQGEECSSACVLMFSAGITRYVSRGSLLGVHSASSRKAGEPTSYEDGDTTVDVAREMAYFGTPANIIGAMVLTKSSEIRWLTTSEVQGWVEFLPDRPAPQTEPADAPDPTRSGNNNFMTCQRTTTRDTYIVTWSGGKTNSGREADV